MSEPSATPRTGNPSRLLPAVGDPVSSFWRRLRRGTRLLRRASDWDRCAGPGWEERIMSEPVTDRLHEKQGRSIGRRVFSEGDAELRVYLKRHYRLPWWRGFLATLFPNTAWSPGLQEWQHLVWADAEGFAVPRPVAAGQLAGPWFRLQGFLAAPFAGGLRAVEARSYRRAGPPRAGTPPPQGLSQGPLLLPLLHPRTFHAHSAGSVDKPGGDD
jgi:hypothetical protein